MPWLFFTAALVSALFTANALRPARGHWLLQGAGFFASWFTGELAFHHLFWQAVAAAFFVYLGAARGVPGWAAIALLGASFGGLVVLAASSRTAERSVEEALRATLGDRYRESLPRDLADPLDEPFGVRQLALPLPVYDARVERVRDVVYATHGGRELRLDIYRRRARGAEHKAPAPTLLWVHGGAWVIGKKDEQGLPLLVRLAAHGWVCASIEYRLSPRATFPDHIIDVKAAIRFMREHGAQFGADPGFIAISGGSAGGHLAALAALTPGDPEYQPGFEAADTHVDACVPFYGVYDFTARNKHWERSRLTELLERYVMKRSRAEDFEAYDRASPMSRVNAEAPPFFVIQGTHDTLVPVEEARAFVELLRAASRAEVAYAEIHRAQHAFEVFPSIRSVRTLRGVERFLTWVYARHRARAGTAAKMGPGRAREEARPEGTSEAGAA